jgi:hypothetical protein
VGSFSVLRLVEAGPRPPTEVLQRAQSTRSEKQSQQTKRLDVLKKLIIRYELIRSQA